MDEEMDSDDHVAGPSSSAADDHQSSDVQKAERNESFGLGFVQTRTSPAASQGSPQASVDESSLQKQRDKNKMSLKVKLMLRRPVNQLVDQGIMPPPKTPSAFFQQRRHLERALTGDILKTKIQRRPDRQALVEQHILEDTRIAPSLHDRTRQLKRAKLADYLNEKISQRPGPLELVQGNILKLSSADNDAAANPVIDGSITFKKTSEGEVGRLAGASETEEEDCSSTASSPTGALSNLKDLQVTSPTSVGTSHQPSTPASLESSSKAPSPTASLVSSSCPSPQQFHQIEQRRRSSLLSGDLASLAQGYPGSSSIPPLPNASHRRSKKCRIKPPAPQKQRTIKFHEYKGPPVVQPKTVPKPPPVPDVSSFPTSSVDNVTRYENNLRQQQLFLQYQVELGQRKMENGDMEPSTSQQPTVAKVECQPQPVIHRAVIQNVRPVEAPVTLTVPVQGHVPIPPPPGRLIIGTLQQNVELSPPAPVEETKSIVDEKPARKIPKYEEMKVNDLKLELKKRSLPVSGSKTQLVERLKNYLRNNPEENQSPENTGVESPPEIKLESDRSSSLPETPTVSDTAPKTFEFTALPQFRSTPQLSFLQLDPVQQQQATAIALQTLALQIPNGISLNRAPVPQMQNLHITAIPSEADQQQRHQTVLSTLPTIFLATSQPPVQNHLSFPSQMQNNSMPYIITMNGLNSTLNLINGFNFNQMVNDHNQQQQTMQQQPAPQVVQTKPPTPPTQSVPQASEAEPTSLQKLQQHLHQKQLMLQLQKLEQKAVVTENVQQQQFMPMHQPPECLQGSSLSQQLTMQTSQITIPMPSYSDNSSGVCLDSNMTTNEESLASSGNTVAEEEKCSLGMFDGSSSGVKTEDAVANWTTTQQQHCTYPGVSDNCVKSEAISDVLEILIASGELPPSAAQDALPKNLILQHAKPPRAQRSASTSSAYYDRRPSSSNPPTSFHISDQPSSPPNTFPLPPISSISPASHGSPVSQSNEAAELSALQQHLAMYEFDYLNSNNQLQNVQQENCNYMQQQQPMDFGPVDQNTNFMDHTGNELPNEQNQQQIISDEDLSAFFDSWLMANGPFLENSTGEPAVDSRDTFSPTEMQTDAFHDINSNNMDTDSYLGGAADSLFDMMFLNDFANPTTNIAGNTGYSSGINSLPGHNANGPIYWPESEQMM